MIFRSFLLRGLAAAACSIAAMAPASASIFIAQGILPDFNKVIFDNGSTSADIEGVSVIGGNFSGEAVTNSNQIDRVLATNQWISSDELHDWQFTGKLPDAPAPVPEPGSLDILGTGLAFLTIYLTASRWGRRKAG